MGKESGSRLGCSKAATVFGMIVRPPTAASEDEAKEGVDDDFEEEDRFFGRTRLNNLVGGVAVSIIYNVFGISVNRDENDN
jgi:hypothetical protein